MAERCANAPTPVESVTFDDIDAYMAAIEDADARATVNGRPEREEWSLCRIGLPDCVHVQLAREGGGNIAEGTIDRATLVLFLWRGKSEGRVNGEPLPVGSTALLPPGREFSIVHDAPHEWMSLQIPLEFVASFGLVPAEPGADPPGRGVLTSSVPAVAATWSLVERFGALALADPRVVDRDAVQKAFRESLHRSVSRLTGPSRATSSPRRGRPSIADPKLIATAVERIEDEVNKTITLSDLVLATGLSERTLRAGFHRFYGVSPHHYIQLRRLHQARSLLREGRPEETTVSAVTAGLGIWDLGRFAGRYRKLFGELPSETLRGRRQASES